MPSAARVHWAKFRVTAVTVLALLILFFLLYKLFGNALLAPKTVIYLYVPDGSGLSNESPVRVDGIDVGRVSTVTLSGSNDPPRVVKVTLSIQRDRLGTIPADSVTQISSDSLIGDKFVDITSGTSPKSITPEGEIIYKFQPELLRSLDLSQFTDQLRIVDAMLADIENGRSQFGKFYKGDQFYNNLQKRLKDLQTAFHAAVGTTSMVGQLLNSDEMHRKISDMLVNVDQQVAQIQAGQGPAGQLLRSSAQYDQLVKLAQGFRQSIATLRGSDLMQSDTVYDNINLSLAALLKTLDDFNQNPELNRTLVYDNLNGSLKELRDNLRDFRLNPHKYLRLKIF